MIIEEKKVSVSTKWHWFMAREIKKKIKTSMEKESKSNDDIKMIPPMESVDKNHGVKMKDKVTVVNVVLGGGAVWKVVP